MLIWVYASDASECFPSFASFPLQTFAPVTRALPSVLPADFKLVETIDMKMLDIETAIENIQRPDKFWRVASARALDSMRSIFSLWILQDPSIVNNPLTICVFAVLSFIIGFAEYLTHYQEISRELFIRNVRDIFNFSENIEHLMPCVESFYNKMQESGEEDQNIKLFLKDQLKTNFQHINLQTLKDNIQHLINNIASYHAFLIKNIITGKKEREKWLRNQYALQTFSIASDALISVGATSSLIISDEYAFTTTIAVILAVTGFKGLSILLESNRISSGKKIMFGEMKLIALEDHLKFKSPQFLRWSGLNDLLDNGRATLSKFEEQYQKNLEEDHQSFWMTLGLKHMASSLKQKFSKKKKNTIGTEEPIFEGSFSISQRSSKNIISQFLSALDDEYRKLNAVDSKKVKKRMDALNE